MYYLLVAFYWVTVILCAASVSLSSVTADLSLHGKLLDNNHNHSNHNHNSNHNNRSNSIQYTNSLIRLWRVWLNWKVPKCWFCDFYLTGLLCSLACWMNSTATPTLFLFMFHLARRLAEQMFVVVTTPTSSMHIAAYILGLSFYIFTPISICCSSSSTSFLLLHSTLFILANFSQLYCHCRLAALRSADKTRGSRRSPLLSLFLPDFVCKSSSSSYSPPLLSSSIFFFSSSPHYCLEILLYLLLCSTCAGDVHMCLCLLFVVITMFTNARRTHLWYQQTCPDHCGRYIIIPFVY
eukprot:GHVS01032421.1.p1 GENE.GHVS01032421.1~~GHVS01032421.1.p1  ORF type:complete len:294 (-),score=53.27 GHVS01032421.1:152-1033(-)